MLGLVGVLGVIGDLGVLASSGSVKVGERDGVLGVDTVVRRWRDLAGRVGVDGAAMVRCQGDDTLTQ